MRSKCRGRCGGCVIFRDSQPEEYAVVLKPDGSLHAVRHTLAEDAPGASLSKEEAVARAEKFLRDEKKIDLSHWALVEAQSDKKPHRTDHTLTWQQNAPLDSSSGSAGDSGSHAYARIELGVLGDQVTDYRTYIKIPDDWRRKQEEVTLPRTILNYGIPILFVGGLGITALLVFLKNLRSEEARAIPWRRLSLWALWGLAAYFLVFALGDRIATVLNAYNTAIPLKTTLGIAGISVLLGGPFNFGFLVLLFGIAWYYAKRAFGEERLPGWTGMPAAYYRDALWIGLGGAGALLGLQTLMQAASQHWPTAHRSAEAGFGADFGATLPAASILGSTLLHALMLAGVVALIASFIAAQLRARWMRFLAFLLGALALAGSTWGSPADFAKQWLAQAIFLGVIVFGVRRVMRFNIMGCFLVLATLALVGAAAELLPQPDAFYRANGYAVLLMLALLLAWPLVAWRMSAGNGAETQGSSA